MASPTSPTSMHFSALPITFPQEQTQRIPTNDDATNRTVRFTTDHDNSLQKNEIPDVELKESRSYLGFGMKPARRFINNFSGNKSNVMQNNSSCSKNGFSFGEEGVQKCDEVVERYKASNYVIQKNMLDDFKKKAEEYRRSKNPKIKRNF